jgi:hypothetical protein
VWNPAGGDIIGDFGYKVGYQRGATKGDAALSIIKELRPLSVLRPFDSRDMFRRIHSDCAAVLFAAKFSALQTCPRLLSLGNND